MRTFLGALIALLISASSVVAQSSPGLKFQQVPTAAQWNSYFAAKQDVLGYTPVNKSGDVMQGALITIAPSAGFAGFNLPQGTAPSSPNNGDLWTTPAGLFVRVNGTTVGPLGAISPSSFAATTPLAVSFPAGVVTYSLAFDSQFVVNGSSQLALSNIAIGTKINGVTISGATGTGNVAFSVSPTFTTPNLGTPSAATLTSATGLPISTGVSGLGTGVATFLATPSSANLAAALTDETGTGAAVFSNAPTFTGQAVFGSANVTSALLFTGNITSSAWLTGGLRVQTTVATFTDTSSSGAVTVAYSDVWGGNTIAATSAVTYSVYVSSYFRQPVAGTNVTITSPFALGADSMRVGPPPGTNGALNVTSAGLITAGPLSTVNVQGTFQLNGTVVSLPISLANGGTNNGGLTASNGGIVWSDAAKLNVLAGTVTAGQCLLSGSSAAPTWGSCSGAAAVSSVSNSDSTLTISPTTGSVIASLNLGHANAWTAYQTFKAGPIYDATGFGCAADGVTNDATCFSNAYAALPSFGGVLQLQGGKVYCIYSNVSINKNYSTINLNGSIVSACGHDTTVFTLTGNRVEIRNGQVIGFNSPTATQPAIVHNNCVACRLYEIDVLFGSRNVQVSGSSTFDYTLTGMSDAYGDADLYVSGASGGWLLRTAVDDDVPNGFPAIPYTAFPTWAATTAIANKALVKTSSNWVLQAMTAGTTSSTQPKITAAFTGSIVGTTLTVSAVTGDGLQIGQGVFPAAGAGINVTPGTVITAGSGTTWTVNNSQTSGSGSMTSGFPRGVNIVDGTVTWQFVMTVAHDSTKYDCSTSQVFEWGSDHSGIFRNGINVLNSGCSGTDPSLINLTDTVAGGYFAGVLVQAGDIHLENSQIQNCQGTGCSGIWFTGQANRGSTVSNNIIDGNVNGITIDGGKFAAMYLNITGNVVTNSTSHSIIQSNAALTGYVINSNVCGGGAITDSGTGTRVVQAVCP